jgi:hypothetical protein
MEGVNYIMVHKTENLKIQIDTIQTRENINGAETQLLGI